MLRSLMILGLYLPMILFTGIAHGANFDSRSYVYVENINSRLALPSHMMIQHMLVSGEVISADLAAKLMRLRWKSMQSKQDRRLDRVRVR